MRALVRLFIYMKKSNGCIWSSYLSKRINHSLGMNIEKPNSLPHSYLNSLLHSHPDSLLHSHPTSFTPSFTPTQTQHIQLYCKCLPPSLTPPSAEAAAKSCCLWWSCGDVPQSLCCYYLRRDSDWPQLDYQYVAGTVHACQSCLAHGGILVFNKRRSLGIPRIAWIPWSPTGAPEVTSSLCEVSFSESS